MFSFWLVWDCVPPPSPPFIYLGSLGLFQSCMFAFMLAHSICCCFFFHSFVLMVFIDIIISIIILL